MGRGEPFNSQSQAIILNVLSFFKREKDVEGPIFPFAAVYARCAAACQVSEQTLRNIQKRLEASAADTPDDRLPRPSTPGRKRPRKKKPKPLKKITKSKEADSTVTSLSVANSEITQKEQPNAFAPIQPAYQMITDNTIDQSSYIIKPVTVFRTETRLMDRNESQELANKIFDSMPTDTMNIWPEHYTIVPRIQADDCGQNLLQNNSQILQRL